jgi:lipoyl-dependent peroxiredoxin
MPTRKAKAEWKGGLKGGTGSFDGESGKIGGAYSFGSRFEEAGGTNPEELLAAAEAACYSMALSGAIEKEGHSPESVRTSAACTVEKVGEGMRITRMALETVARVPGMDEEEFRRIAEATKSGCPVSKAFEGNLELTVEARLEG